MKKRLLVTNDDGFASVALVAIVKALQTKYDVLVVAPAENCSGFAHSVTFGKRIAVKRVADTLGAPTYAVKGTPADCVKFAHECVKEYPFVGVVSGINIGSNIGSDIMYSATVAAGMEAAFLGYPAVALSHCDFGAVDLEEYASIAERLVTDLLPEAGEKRIFSVNFPPVPVKNCKGVVLAPLGEHRFTDEYEEVSEGEFVLDGVPLEVQPNEPNADVEMIKNGYITVTPLVTNRTDYGELDRLKDKDFGVIHE